MDLPVRSEIDPGRSRPDDPIDGRITVHDETATFSSFFGSHFAHLARLAVALGSDDPEDVAQEALARVFARRSSLRDPAADVAYARSIVCNLVRSRGRRHAVAQRFLRSFRDVPHAAEPFQLVAADDESRRVVAAVLALPTRQREVIALRYWAGLSEKEIADVTGVSPGTVKTHAARAMKALHQTLGREL